jgi:hypothetical protein
MKTKTLQQKVKFKASPIEVYEMLIDRGNTDHCPARQPRSAKKWVVDLPAGNRTFPGSAWPASLK